MNNLEFTGFCKALLSLNTLYMWGTYGQKITGDLIYAKAKQYPNNYSESRQSFLKVRAAEGGFFGCDCVGILKWFLWSGGDLNAKIKYDSKTDRNCSMLWNSAKIKGPIATLPEKAGVMVYKSGHVGVYVGAGRVIECTLGSRGDGIVETPLAVAKWTNWLYVPEIEYKETINTTAKDEFKIAQQRIMAELKAKRG